MEIKDKPPAGETEKAANNLLKQRINIFLISYFSYLNLALVLIIFLAGLFLFIYPQYQRMVEGNETAQIGLTAEYEEKYNYLKDIRELKNSYGLISAEARKKIEDMVPAGGEVVGLIPEIELIVLKNGVILDSIKIASGDLGGQAKTKIIAETGKKPELPAGSFERLPEGAGRVKMEIKLSSINYLALKNLLKSLENNLRLLDISKLEYSAPENTAMVTAYAYYLPN